MKLTWLFVSPLFLFFLGCNCGEGQPPPPTFSFQLIDGQTDENLLSDSTKMADLSIEGEQRHTWVSYSPSNQSVEITSSTSLELEIQWRDTVAFLMNVVILEEDEGCYDYSYIDRVTVEGADLEEPAIGSETYRILL